MVTNKSQTTMLKALTTKPYTERVEEQHGTGVPYVIREFEDSVLEEELVWHRDKESRQVSVLSGSNWSLQHDDELPILLNQGEEYYIPKMTYHRLIKGQGNLVVRIRIT
jgi:hypothetical protein